MKFTKGRVIIIPFGAIPKKRFHKKSVDRAIDERINLIEAARRSPVKKIGSGISTMPPSRIMVNP